MPAGVPGGRPASYGDGGVHGSHRGRPRSVLRRDQNQVSVRVGGQESAAEDIRDHLALYGLDDAQRDQLGGGADSRRARGKVVPRGRAVDEPLLPLSAVVTTDSRPPSGPHGGTTQGVPDEYT